MSPQSSRKSWMGWLWSLLGLLFGYVSGENPGPQPKTHFRFFK